MMSCNAKKIYKISLFIFGIIIITLGIFMLKDKQEITAQFKFFCAMIYMAYCVFFAPLLFNTLHWNSFAEHTPIVVLSWLLMKAFVAISLILGVLVYSEKIKIPVACIIEGVVLFIALLFIFVGLCGTDHIQKVAVKEEQLLSKIKTIRAKMQQLSLQASTLGDSYNLQKKSLEKITEDLRYLSPVSTSEAIALENKILSAIDSITNAIQNLSNNSSSSNVTLQSCINNLDFSIKQRKLLLN